MKNFLYTALMLLFCQGALASDLQDQEKRLAQWNQMDHVIHDIRIQCTAIEGIIQKERLLHHIRQQCGNAAEYDQHHAVLMRIVPLSILQQGVARGWFTHALDAGPGLRNKGKGSVHCFSPQRISYEQENGGYMYHYFEEKLSHKSEGNEVILDLCCQRLAFLPPRLGIFTALTSLRLNANCLTVVPGSLLAGLPHLESLYLNGNSICALPDEIGGLTCLKILNVEDNPFITLPDTCVRLLRLEEFFLSASQIATNVPLLRTLQDQQQAQGYDKVGIFEELKSFDLTNLSLVEGTLIPGTDAPNEDWWGGEGKSQGNWSQVIRPLLEE